MIDIKGGETMRLKKLGVILLGVTLFQGTILGEENKEYKLSEAVQKIINTEKNKCQTQVK